MMEAVKTSRFDLSQIGEADRRNLAATFLEAVQRFFEDSANLEKFEKWQSEERRLTSDKRIEEDVNHGKQKDS